jgi:hypothetical protein
MKTRIRFKPRQSGKTTKLIKKSHKNNIPIVTGSLFNVDYIKKMANNLNLCIPEPLTYYQVLDNKVKGKVYFDDIEYLFRILSDKFGVEILEATASDEYKLLKERGFIN